MLRLPHHIATTRLWIAFMVEFILMAFYLLIAWKAILFLFQGHIEESFMHISDTLWIINIGLMVSSCVYFCYRPIRNTGTILMGIWNLNWLAANLFLMYPF